MKSDARSSSAHPPGGESHLRRQFVNFGFGKLDREWRRLDREERNEHRREFREVIQHWSQPETMKILTYCTIGIRGECDFLLWRICYSLDCLQEMAAHLARTRLGGYLTMPYSFLGMTKRSQYLMGETHQHQALQGVIRAGDYKYLSVHPFVKTGAWYQLPFEQRQRVVGEALEVAKEFPRVRMDIIYSFGLDDQDFVLAYESNHPEELVDMAMRLRETENSMYTERNTPNFTCVQTTPEEMLERIG